MVPREGREEEKERKEDFEGWETRGRDTYVLKKIYTGTVAKGGKGGGKREEGGV